MTPSAAPRPAVAPLAVDPEVLAEVFGLDADVVADPLLGHPVVLPRGDGDRR